MGAMPQTLATDEIAALERFLKEGGAGSGDDLPSLQTLRESGLAAYAWYCSVPGDELRTAFLGASARHAAVKGRLKRLLGAWNEAGVVPLMFKGFHLAEFVYPSPGGRLYSDVDLLISEKDAVQLAEIAIDQGWREMWNGARPTTVHSLRGPRYEGHEILQLMHPRMRIQIDVHRRLVHNNHNSLNRFEMQDRITQLVWNDSLLVGWDDVQVRVPRAVDAVLVGLVLNRSWSPEDWHLRPHDYLDFRFLVEKYQVTPEKLRMRAKELNCSRTLELFLGRCNPFDRTCVLSRPTWLELQHWNLLVASERGNRYLERSLVNVRSWVSLPLDLIEAMPDVLHALFLAHRSENVRAAAERVQSPSVHTRPMTARKWKKLRQSVHRCLRLLGKGGYGFRDLEALALLVALRRRSCPAVLTWAKEDAHRVTPRLELDGAALNVAGTLLSNGPRMQKQRRARSS